MRQATFLDEGEQSMKVFGRSAGRGLALVTAVMAAVGIAAGAAVARAFVQPKPIGTGVVVVETSLGYQQAAAAGTGMVLSKSGLVLTNNHVIRGATSLRVVVPHTGKSYPAQVVGYDVADDVAVIKLTGAANLATVKLGDSTKLRLGQSVVALGNAGGGGSLVSAPGKVTGLGKTITASDDQGTSEQLTGLIETDAGVQPGDSGGPLMSAGKVVGMTTAASAQYSFMVQSNDAYAIPIKSALAVEKLITSGQSTVNVHIGGTAFLGVQVQSSDFSQGALVGGVVSGSPADKAGIVAGDSIVAVDGQTVSAPDDLSAIMLSKKPGASAQLTWVDQVGNQQSASVTLASGPPQ
jgi:S1-C subfamily serine protease